MTAAPEACPSIKFSDEQENESSSAFCSTVENLHESMLKNRLSLYTESHSVAEQLQAKVNNLMAVGYRRSSNITPSEKMHRSSLMLIAEASALQSHTQS